MPAFSYKARDIHGKFVQGTLQASTQKSASETLQAQGYILLSLHAEATSSVTEQVNALLRRVPLKQIVIFTRQLATMIDSSLPIVQALRILIKQTEHEEFRAIILKVTGDVEGGTELSVALSQYPDVFSDFYISIVRSGESSGRLSDSLLYLADYLERDSDLRSKVRSALIYPTFLLAGIVVVGIIAVTYVVPQLNTVFDDAARELPLSTRVLIGVSDYFRSFWWLNIIIVVGLVGVVYGYARTAEGRLLIDTAKIRIPILGTIYKKVVMARFSQTLSTLLKGSIPVVRALHVVADVLGNKVYEKIILSTARKIEDGSSLADGLAEHDEVPTMVVQMTKIGEQTGKLDDVLTKISTFYKREVDTTLGDLVTILEPVILVILGVGLGLLFGALILPIYQLAATI